MANKSGYKHTELGWIPNEWEIRELKTIGTFLKGKGISRDEIRENGLPCIRYGEIYTSYDNYFSSTISFIDEASAKESQLVNQNDLLFSGSGESAVEIGKCVAYLGNQNIYAGGDIIILRPTSGNSKYLSFILNYKTSIKQKSVLGQGHTVVHIYPNSLGKVKVSLPTLPEQKKIGEILSTWDIAIETTENLIKAKKKLKLGLMQRLLTGKLRFKEFLKNNELIKTKNGRVPKDWQFLKASEIFKRHSQNCMGNLELLSVTQDRGVIPRSILEARVTMPSGSTESFKLVSKGDFVISLRAFEGGIEYSEYEGLVSPAYTIIKPILPIDNGYFKFYFKSKDFISKLAIAVIGIRDGKQISWEDFGFIRLFYPSVNEQKKISLTLLKLDNEIGILNFKLKALKFQKKGLMQKLLTGELRVNI